jgi:hypothetical protein
MNIFFLSANPRRCARWHCDKHVVKMILESTQILYTANHVNGGTVLILTAAPICSTTGARGYKKHAAKHPSVLWCSESLAHYFWLIRMALCLVDEHAHRFNPKERHKCEEHLLWLRANPPPGLLGVSKWYRDPPPAMPDKYKISDFSVICYWAYYAGSKRDRGLFKWSRRGMPHVFRDERYSWMKCN